MAGTIVTVESVFNKPVDIYLVVRSFILKSNSQCSMLADCELLSLFFYIFFFRKAIIGVSKVDLVMLRVKFQFATSFLNITNIRS